MADGSSEIPNARFAEDALARAVDILRHGGIVGLKGIGGYHLLCDATSADAVRSLRARKRRPGKPLAVMVPREGLDGLDAARQLVEIGPAVAAALTSEAHPIVLVRRVRDTSRDVDDSNATRGDLDEIRGNNGRTAIDGNVGSDERRVHDVGEIGSHVGRVTIEVAPGLRELGLMLPYSPLHELLLGAFGRPLVATSGNSSGEPLVFTRRDAEKQLDGLADAILHHDRPILRPIDDSVLRDFGDAIVPIRIGRGLAPLELRLPQGSRVARLAVGGHMKNTVALAWGDRVILSPHLGDLERPRAFDAFVAATESLRALYQVQPDEILADAHPDYASARWARKSGIPVRTVPHHRAHASALAGEHPDVRRWLIFAWDGVGLGEDGSLWGGEVFHGSPGRWHRVGSLRSFRIVGAGRAGREPLRSAQSLVWELGLELPSRLQPRVDGSATSLSAAIARQAWERSLGTSITTAAGRIFDAAAAILLGRNEYDYEAQGPMELEAAADGCVPGPSAISLPMEPDTEGVWRMDWEPLVSRLLDEDLPVAERSALLHTTLAEAAVTFATRIHSEWPFDAVGLTGGVFQNRRLTEEVWARSRPHGLDVRIARQVPMNDGGLAYGQIVEAIATEA